MTPNSNPIPAHILRDATKLADERIIKTICQIDANLGPHPEILAAVGMSAVEQGVISMTLAAFLATKHACSEAVILTTMERLAANAERINKMIAELGPQAQATIDAKTLEAALSELIEKAQSK